MRAAPSAFRHSNVSSWQGALSDKKLIKDGHARFVIQFVMCCRWAHNQAPQSFLCSDIWRYSVWFCYRCAVSSAYTHKEEPLVAGGALVIGGEQDCFGGCVDPAQVRLIKDRHHESDGSACIGIYGRNHTLTWIEALWYRPTNCLQTYSWKFVWPHPQGRWAAQFCWPCVCEFTHASTFNLQTPKIFLPSAKPKTHNCIAGKTIVTFCTVCFVPIMRL